MKTLNEYVEQLAEAEQFHVYHKVKGDRLGGPDFDHVKSFDSKDEADAHASKYRPPNGFHSHVVVNDKRHKMLTKQNARRDADV